MSITEGMVLFVVIWWAVLFVVLPFGVRSQHEDGAVEDGTEPAAPVRPMMWHKATITTGVAIVLWGIAYWVIANGIITLDSFPGYDPRTPD